MKPLKMFCIGAEIAVVASLAASSYYIAVSGMRSSAELLAAAPLVTILALESLRLPIAFHIPKQKLLGMAMSIAMVCGISVITMEAASMAFENLIFQRTRPVVEAEAALKTAVITHDSIGEVNARHNHEIARLTADLESARKHREEVGDQKPPTMPIPGDRIVTTRDKQGRVRQWNAAAGAQNTAAKADASAITGHLAELKAATDAVTKAQDALSAVSANAPEMHSSDEEVAHAKQKVADARSQNPMFRVAATWQRVPVQDLTSEEFEAVKHYAVIALAAATAFVTALAAVISSLPERTAEGESKLGRALRKTLAARRKTLRRIKERVVTEVKERTKIVYVPVDATGAILDPAFKAAPADRPNLRAV
jgi:hypothetical protein